MPTRPGTSAADRPKRMADTLAGYLAAAVVSIFLLRQVLSSTPRSHSVLVLGGGDGLAARELLRRLELTESCR